MDLSPPAQRVLGCLLEKALATPQQYPLTLNALRTACNQATGREPVVDYDDNTVEAALGDLRQPSLVRTEVVRGSRTPKYAHRLQEELGLDRPEQAVMALLLLRGAQTEGELRTRSDRLHGFSSLEEVDRTLAALAQRGHVEHLERRPGEKAARWHHRWGPTGEGVHGPAGRAAEVATPARRVAPEVDPPAAQVTPVEHDASVPVGPSPTAEEVADLRDRIEALEAEVAELRRQLESATDERPAPGLL